MLAKQPTKREPKKEVAYLIGSLRNPNIPTIASAIRTSTNIEVFDDWYAAGPEADDYWQRYETTKGCDYGSALESWAAQHVFSFDKFHLDRASMGVLVLPAGKSCHLEFGYLMGQGKRGYILFDKEPDRWDIMYNFATKVFFNLDDLVKTLQDSSSSPVSVDGLMSSREPSGPPL